MIPILVFGAGGRMGGHVLRAVDEVPDLRLVAAVDRADHPRQGQEMAPGVKLEADPALGLDAARVAIDFSSPAGTLALLVPAAEQGVALVIGTTGFEDRGRARIEATAHRVPIVMAPNFSPGVNLLIELVSQAARRLPDYEIEVLEMHHSQKADAPSGTALRLAEAAAEARGRDLARDAVYHREGRTGARPPRAIGLQSLRAGDSVGEHTVYLAGPGERLELAHRALSRGNFAAGAVRAARWVVGRKAGLYSMADVLAD